MKGKKLEGTLIDNQHRKISFCSWVPQKTRFQIVIIHGFAEHYRRYEKLAEALCEQSIAVHMADLPGHGLSEGNRGYINYFSEYLSHLNWFVKSNPNVMKTKPMFLMGHSMGGLIASQFCLHYPGIFQGLILTAPLTGFSLYPSVLLYLTALRMAKKTPKRQIPKGFDISMACRDRSKWEEYRSDPLRLHIISPKLFKFMFEEARNLMKEAHSLQIPLLLFSSSRDRIISAAKNFFFYSKVGSLDKTFVVFTEAMHEIVQEKEYEQLLPKMTSWMEDRS